MTDPSQERTHPPGSSLWPIGFAAGVACLLLGLVISWLVALIGAILAAVFGLLWARDVTRDVRGEVPEVEPETRVVAEPDATAAPAAAAEPLPAYTRSRFLEAATVGVGAAIGAVVTLPVLGFMVLPSFTNVEEGEVDLGPIENFPEGEFVITNYLAAPGQGEVSRRTAFIRYNGLTEAGEPSFTILYGRCVHLGCPVQPNGPIDDNARKELDASSSDLCSPSRLAAPATARSTTPRGTERLARPCALWTGTRTRSVAAGCSSTSSTRWEASPAQGRTRGSLDTPGPRRARTWTESRRGCTRSSRAR